MDHAEFIKKLSKFKFLFKIDEIEDYSENPYYLHSINYIISPNVRHISPVYSSPSKKDHSKILRKIKLLIHPDKNKNLSPLLYDFLQEINSNQLDLIQSLKLIKNKSPECFDYILSNVNIELSILESVDKIPIKIDLKDLKTQLKDFKIIFSYEKNLKTYINTFIRGLYLDFEKSIIKELYNFDKKSNESELMMIEHKLSVIHIIYPKASLKNLLNYINTPIVDFIKKNFLELYSCIITKYIYLSKFLDHMTEEELENICESISSKIK